jgi:ABC-type multidrug transport system fused ATPase/permease subunit
MTYLRKIRKYVRARGLAAGRNGVSQMSPAGWRDVRELMSAHRRLIASGILLMLVSRVAALIVPATSKWVIDDVLDRGRTELLLPIVLVAGAATFVRAATTFGVTLVAGLAMQRAVSDLRKRVQARVIRMPLRYFDVTQTGDIISRVMTDTESVRNLLGPGLLQLAGALVTLLLGLGVLFWLNWALTGFTLLVIVAFGASMTYTFHRLRPLFCERAKIKAEITVRLTEALGGIRIVKCYTAEKREALVFARGVHRLVRNLAKSRTGVSAAAAMNTALVGVLGVLITWLGCRAVLTGDMTLGDLLMYIFFVGVIIGPLGAVSSIGAQITEALAGLERIREVLELPTEPRDAPRLHVPLLRGDVTLQDVWFEYQPGIPVLRGVSLHAPPGTTTALVGASGSGKTTLSSLLLAFNRPTRGVVLIDGYDLATLRLEDYRCQLAAVLQESFLFEGSILENIAYARPNATMQQLNAACRLAHCDEFISTLPRGYDTPVGERGVRLSAGQRQRVSIARAILADPRILVLDEATSSLDSRSEQMIQDGLRQLRTGRTTFVIAHRLSTVRNADQVLVVEAGTIVERGTHAELLALNGRYRLLCDEQYTLAASTAVAPGDTFRPERDGSQPLLPRV